MDPGDLFPESTHTTTVRCSRGAIKAHFFFFFQWTVKMIPCKLIILQGCEVDVVKQCFFLNAFLPVARLESGVQVRVQKPPYNTEDLGQLKTFGSCSWGPQRLWSQTSHRIFSAGWCFFEWCLLNHIVHLFLNINLLEFK